jgi:hypothetical protein
MRSLTTLLAVAIAMCLCGTALASSLEPPGSTAPSTSPPQDVRNPDNRVPPGHPGQVPDTSASLRAAANSDTSRIVSSVSSDSGLSAFLIVLISVGGVVAIAGAAVVTTRAVHHHPHGLT